MALQRTITISANGNAFTISDNAGVIFYQGSTSATECYYGANNGLITLKNIYNGTVVLDEIAFGDLINQATGLAFTSLANFQEFAALNFFRKATGGGGIEYATTQEVINASNVVGDGDSFTAGEGSYNNTYLNQFATLSGLRPYNNGISGTTSAQILARVQAATNRLGYAHIIWSGRNDIPTATTAATIEANIASTVYALGHLRYIVIGILPDNSEASNSDNYIKMAAVNTNSASVYGTRFINALTVLQAHGDGSANDNADIAAGRVPRSLQADTLHLNATGYSWIATAVYAKLSLLQVSSTSVVSLNAAPAVNQFSSNQLPLPNGSKITIGGMQILSAPGVNSGNLFVGDAGSQLTSGINNFSGSINALKALTSGNQNVAIGNYSAYNVTTGSENICIGFSSGGGGNFNWCVFIGNQAGNNVTTAYGCLVIGHNTYAQNATSNFQMSIQEAIYGTNLDGSQGTISAGNIGMFVKAPTARLDVIASAASAASLRVRHGTAPTIPNDGDIWTTTSGLFTRINGVTKTVTLT